jgi:hypothetical protein
MALFRKRKTAPPTMAERLDALGPHYQEIYGALHRAIGLIHEAAHADHPIEATRLDLICRYVINAAAGLERTQEDTKAKRNQLRAVR